MGRDCVYGDWENWNACGKCGGQRKRFRHIVQHAQDGEKNCEKFDSEELGACPFICEEKGHCVWSNWGEFGPCTAQCGKGKRMRMRSLVFTAEEEKDRTLKTMHALSHEKASNLHNIAQEFE